MATAVSRHLVAAGTLIDVDPATAYRHAKAAARRAGRVAVVREAAGLTAYRAGEYSDALKELRAHRRMTGSSEHLPVMADCERGLGRPQRALEIAADPAFDRLPVEVRAEMRIVAAGARQDLAQPEAALVTLQGPELSRQRSTPWWARLATAYADALLAVGRDDEATQWLQRAADADPDGSSGAAERLGLGADSGELDDYVIWQEEAEDAAELPADVARGSDQPGSAD
jgi:predicted Zn-dependent protease